MKNKYLKNIKKITKKTNKKRIIFYIRIWNIFSIFVNINKLLKLKYYEQ